jgi:hypothetical protein
MTGSMLNAELFQSLVIGNFPSLLKKKDFVHFSLLNQHYHSYFKATICHTVTFQTKSGEQIFIHYEIKLMEINFNPKTYLYLEHLPSTLTHLTFGPDFNLPVNELPSKLTHLTFGYAFNLPVLNLPQHITLHLDTALIILWMIFLQESHIIFGFLFNQRVNLLPGNSTHIKFGREFNKPVERLPPKLILISFWDNFNQAVDSLPLSLNHLSFGKNFNKRLPTSPTSHLVGIFYNQ